MSIATNHPSDREFTLIGGVLCLDFANTCSGREGAFYEERILTLSNLIAWSLQSECLDWAENKIENAVNGLNQRQSASLVRTARSIRDNIYAVMSAISSNETPSADRLKALQDHYVACLRVARFSVQASDGCWDWRESSVLGAAIFGPILQSFFEYLSKIDNARLKCCPALDCKFIFHDFSKNKSRLWCDMAICGNRAKSRRFGEKN
ncbi:CGNR zinc finger domain-containing protein [Parasedimentitalea huanghaiensis]|uniref:Zinc finger CGNR domain-containing protein n=1 Tax=Parasedimentitalea huanghaiensis TaxID=2682100 RepID=A0A6L6WEN8_9RHOB|nr:CGNR zinc finger domain-containing protein [Zongyanglinia huanghaiensis]MVO14477.1 hypothetical protein [Zongyanglinia huanghaiensis]